MIRNVPSTQREREGDPTQTANKKKRGNVYHNNMGGLRSALWCVKCREYCPSIFMVRVSQSKAFHKLKGVKRCLAFGGCCFLHIHKINRVDLVR